MATPQEKTLIAFATAWGSKFGGINAFNSDLLHAVADAYRSHIRTVCVVLHATDKEIQEAEDARVTLVALRALGESKFSQGLVVRTWDELQKRSLPYRLDQTIWLGHDRITGAIAIEAAAKYGGRSALIHHMSYAHYETFAEDSASAQVKEDEQKRLFGQCHHRLAVGPLLRDALADLLSQPVDHVRMLIPGLATITTKPSTNTFRAFLSGRLDESARKIKQASLGVAAFGHAVNLCDSNSGLPDALRGAREPRLTLRGLHLEHARGDAQGFAEADLQRYAAEQAGRAINLRVLPFTEDREELFEELSAASVCLMPSWHEGFGLVAWEAIAAGVPLIVSAKSGVFRLLESLENGLHARMVQRIDVLGTTDEPFFHDKDKSTLANLLIETAKNPAKYKSLAITLRETLRARYTWRSCADALIDALDWTVRKNEIVSNHVAMVHEQLTASPARIPFGAWLKKLGASQRLYNSSLLSSGLIRVGYCTLLDAPLDIGGYREMVLDRQPASSIHDVLHKSDIEGWRSNRTALITAKVAGTSLQIVRFVGEVTDDRHVRLAYQTIDYVDARAYFSLLLEPDSRRAEQYREEALRVLGDGTRLPNILSTGIVTLVGSEDMPELVIAKRKGRTGGFDGNTWAVSIAEQFMPISGFRGDRYLSADESVEGSIRRGLLEELLGETFSGPMKIAVHAFCMEDNINNFIFVGIADLRPLTFETLATLWLEADDRGEHEAVAAIPATEQSLLACATTSSLPPDLWASMLASQSVRFRPGLSASEGETANWQPNSHIRLALALWYIEGLNHALGKQD